MRKGGATEARMESKHRISGPLKLAAGGSGKVRVQASTKSGKPMKAKGMCS